MSARSIGATRASISHLLGLPYPDGGAAAAVADLAALKALTSRPGVVITQYRATAGDGGGGEWIFRAGDQSSNVTDDAESGLWAAPDSDPTGASGAWQRQWDGVTGYVEWFGGGVGVADNLTALGACTALCPVTQLLIGDYAISTTFKFQTPHRRLRGLNRSRTGADTVTAILVTGGSANVIQRGPDAEPASVNDFMQELWIEDLMVRRSLDPVISAASSGILSQFTLRGGISGVKSIESMYGFRFIGTVGETHYDNHAFRSSAGTGGGTDYFHGFYIDGNTDIGLAGGNASIQLVNNRTGVGGITIDDSSGVFVDNNFTDCWIHQHETTTVAIGIDINGNGSATANYGNVDLAIVDCRLDGFAVAGIRIQNVSKYGSIDINGGYAAPNSTSADVLAGIYLNASLGLVTCQGFETIGRPNDLCSGMSANDSSGFQFEGCRFVDCQAVPVLIADCTNFVVKTQSSNYSETTSAAVSLSGTNAYGVIAPMVIGDTNKCTLGVQLLSTTSTNIEIDVSGIDSNCINGGAANRLVYNGGQITQPGAFGTYNTAVGTVVPAAWTSYTVTPVAWPSGALTTVTATGEWRGDGNTTHFRISVTVTAKGTATGMYVNLPRNAVAGTWVFQGGYSTTQMVPFIAVSGITGVGYLNFYADTGAGAQALTDGSVYTVCGTYEAA